MIKKKSVRKAQEMYGIDFVVTKTDIIRSIAKRTRLPMRLVKIVLTTFDDILIETVANMGAVRYVGIFNIYPHKVTTSGHWDGLHKKWVAYNGTYDYVKILSGAKLKKAFRTNCPVLAENVVIPDELLYEKGFTEGLSETDLEDFIE